MNEVTLRNEGLGLSMTKATINGTDVVLAENVREALEWDRISNMVYGLKDGKEVLKIRVSDLKSAGWNFLKFQKVQKNTLYVYFLTRQGVSRLIATRRPHDIKDNPELADKLDKLQDWIFGEVLPEVMTTGRYSGRPLVAGQHAITETPTRLSDALRLMADEYDAHELTIKTVEEQNNTIREQQSHIEWIDSQRIGMAESCARFAPVKDKPCDDAKPVRGSWRMPALLADGEFNVRRNNGYKAMIRRAIRERCIPDYELSEFRTVIDADDIKGTKHTRDECALLSMLNAGHIGVIPTIF